MAYTITINSVEAECLTKTQIEGVNDPAPGFLTFNPSEALSVIERLSKGDYPFDNVESLIGRLATLHGQWIMARAEAASNEEQAFDEAAAQVEPQDSFPEELEQRTVAEILEQKPDEEGDEPAEEPAPSKRGRKSA